MKDEPARIRLEIDDPFVRLIRREEVVFEEDFEDHLQGLGAEARERWLRARGAIVLDEYVDGAFDTNGELDPWEPD